MMIRSRLPCLNFITVMEKSRSSKSLNLLSITSWMVDFTLEDSDLNASDWSDDSASVHWVFHSSVSRYLFISKMFSNHLFFPLVFSSRLIGTYFSAESSAIKSWSRMILFKKRFVECKLVLFLTNVVVVVFVITSVISTPILVIKLPFIDSFLRSCYL